MTQPLHIKYPKLPPPEKAMCSVFSCGRELTITEQLCGNKCLGCQGKKDKVFKHYKL